MLSLNDLRDFLKGNFKAAAPAPAADRPRIGPPRVGPPAGLFTAPQPGEFARRLMAIAGFGDALPHSRDKVLLGLDPGLLANLPTRVDHLSRSAARPFDVVVVESTRPASAQLATSLFKKLQGENDLEAALERICQATLQGFAHGIGKGNIATRPPGTPGAAQTDTVVVASIRDDRFDDEARESSPVHLLMFATRIGTDEQIKAGEGLEFFVIRQECVRWEPQLFEEYTERVYKRHFERLAKSDSWRQAFVIEEERKKAAALRRVATRALPELGATPDFEKGMQKACVDLMEEVAKGFGLRSKNERLLECFDLPKSHDIAADASVRDRGEPNPLPGLVVRDHTSRLLGYIVYCVDSRTAVGLLRERLQKDNCFHNVLVIFPDATGPSFELWQGTDKLEGNLVRKGAAMAADTALISLLSRFFVVGRNRLADPKELAEALAKRARFLRRLAERQLQEEATETLPEKRQLTELYTAFKSGLIHGMNEGEFADAYAQTMTYGLLSARWISKDELKEEAALPRKQGEPVPQFTRAYAQTHLHSTSPFLQALFEKVLHEKFESKLAWLLDDIAALLNQIKVDDVFDPAKVKSEVSSDPVIHFYEPFLAAYDKDLKKARGVYYTPQPVVSFIVRSVDSLLKTDFGLVDGLASTESWADVSARLGVQPPQGTDPQSPFVAILDPATGTGTFIVTVVDQIYQNLRSRWEQEGKDVAAEWQRYVPEFLLPRIHAFELMVASYAIAHLKFGLKLRELGYFSVAKRANIFLTNALEPVQSSALGLSLEALNDEVKAANAVKQGKAITVVVGNPPYSGVSANEGAWVHGLLRGEVDRHNYFMVDGKPLGERNPKWLNDDYVKFIRYAQYRIGDSGAGVLGFITNHGYLDNPTFRGMRRSLMESFPHIQVIDLHGNVKKKEKAPDGGVDENVFDIMQGVAIGVMSTVGAVGVRAFPKITCPNTIVTAIPLAV